MFAATVFVSLLAAVSAVPTSGHNTQEAQACGNSNQVCCNRGSVSKINQGLTVDALNDLLASGGACDDSHLIDLVGLNGVLKRTCTADSICCTRGVTGSLVDLSCNKIL